MGGLSEAERSARVHLLHSLGWEDIDPELPLFSYGLVSVQASALLSAITAMVGASPPDDLLLSHPSVNALASYVAEHMTLAKSVSEQNLPPPDWLGEVPLRGDGSLGGFTIRRAELEESKALVALDDLSWKPPLRGFTRNEIEARIQRFQSGQLVVCDESGAIVGSLYSQRITSTEQLRTVSNFHESLSLHHDFGPIWQLLSVQLLPAFSSRGLGDLLVNYALTVARASPGVHRVIAVTRCRNWADALNRQPNLTLQEYLERGSDPGIVFHTARGAKITALIDDWRPEDVDNDGIGVLVEYDLPSFRLIMDKSIHEPLGLEPNKGVGRKKSTMEAAQAERKAHVHNVVAKLVEGYVEAPVSADAPLMEAGLDSYRMQSFIHVALALLSNHFPNCGNDCHASYKSYILRNVPRDSVLPFIVGA